MTTTTEPLPLSSTEVNTMFANCVLDDRPDESADVDCIVFTARFSVPEVEARRDRIREMLLELPTGFRQSEGGGWSFLEACMDRHGNQWTGEHRTQAMLFGLGQAAGLVKPLFPREMWAALPGGMPYYVVLDKEPA